jgi:voltage-gated potassium channel Kch
MGGGQGVGRILHSYGVGVTVLEQDPTQIEIVRKFGWKTYYGDVSRLEMLEASGAANAELLILAIDDMEAAHRTIEQTKAHFPHLKILVRAENRLDAYRFAAQGIETSRVTMSAALEMGERALRLLGTPAFEARRAVQWFKNYDDVLFKRSMAVLGDEKAMISLSKESRDEMTALMAADAKRAVERSSEGWG